MVRVGPNEALHRTCLLPLCSSGPADELGRSASHDTERAKG